MTSTEIVRPERRISWLAARTFPLRAVCAALLCTAIALARPAGAMGEADSAAFAFVQELGKDAVREALLRIGDSPNLIQLLEPIRADSPVQKAIDRNGGKGGLNHVGFRVKDIQLAFEHMKQKGFQILDAAPRPGSRGTTVFFVHPKALADTPLNVMIEVVQE